MLKSAFQVFFSVENNEMIIFSEKQKWFQSFKRLKTAKSAIFANFKYKIKKMIYDGVFSFAYSFLALKKELQKSPIDISVTQTCFSVA